MLHGVTSRYMSPRPPSGLRSAVFNGVTSYAQGVPASAGDVPSAATAWRFLAKLRGLVPHTDHNSYIFYNSPGDVLILYLVAAVAGSYQLSCFAGGGLASPGSVSWSTTQDVVIQVRVNSSGSGEVSIEVWDHAGNLLSANRNTASGTTTTAFFQNYAIGALTGGSAGFLQGKCDKATFLLGAGQYGVAMPDVENTNGDIMQWNFDNDTTNDSVSTCHLSTAVDITYENTP